MGCLWCRVFYTLFSSYLNLSSALNWKGSFPLQKSGYEKHRLDEQACNVRYVHLALCRVQGEPVFPWLFSNKRRMHFQWRKTFFLHKQLAYSGPFTIPIFKPRSCYTIDTVMIPRHGIGKGQRGKRSYNETKRTVWKIKMADFPPPCHTHSFYALTNESVCRISCWTGPLAPNSTFLNNYYNTHWFYEKATFTKCSSILKTFLC